MNNPGFEQWVMGVYGRSVHEIALEVAMNEFSLAPKGPSSSETSWERADEFVNSLRFIYAGLVKSK